MTQNSQLNQKLLAVSYSMPPAHSGSSVVVTNLFRQFAMDQVVVAGERWPENRSHGAKPVPSNFVYLWNQPTFKSSTLRVLFRILAWPLIFFRLVKTFKQQKCQAVLGVFPSEYYVFQAYAVSRWLGVPFYSYFHNTYLDNRKGWRRLWAKFVQTRVFRRSRTVFVMSEGMESYLHNQYPDQEFKALVHIFEKPDESANAAETFEPQADPTPLKIGFLGNINSSNIDAFRRFCQSIEGMNIQFQLFSSISDTLLQRFDIDTKQLEIVRVPFGEELCHLREQDLLFLPHGLQGGLNEVEYKTIFPTKTIPYLLAGRPILAHTPETSFLTQWLRKHDCAAVTTRADSEELKKALSDLLANPARQKELVKNAATAAQTFEPARVAKFFADTMNGATVQ